MARHIRNSLYSQTVEGPLAFGSVDDIREQLIVDHEPIVPITPTRSSGASTIIYLVGLSEGLTHLAALAIYYLLKDDLGMGPSETSAILVLPALPWFIKPALAFLSDTQPIFGYRRKPYLIFFSILEAIGYALLAFHSGSLTAVAFALCVISLGAAFCSAVTEALVVEVSAFAHPNRPIGSMEVGRTQQELDAQVHKAANTSVTELLGAKAIGSLIVAYLSGALLETYTKKQVFLTTAIFPLLITLAGLFYKEVPYYLNNRAEENEELRRGPSFLIGDSETQTRRISPGLQLKVLGEFLRQKIIWGPSLFILMFMAGPDYDDALFFYYTTKLNFTPRFMGSLRFTYGLAALIGLVIYNKYLANATYRSIMVCTILINFPVYISPLLLVTGENKKIGISNEVFVLSGGFLIEAVAELQLLPLLVFTALICPPGLEGSVYSVMMSVRNLGAALGKLSSAIATYAFGITETNFARLVPFIVVCGCFTLIPLFFTNLIPTQIQMEEVRKSNLSANKGGPPPALIASQEIWADVQKTLISEGAKSSNSEGTSFGGP